MINRTWQLRLRRIGVVVGLVAVAVVLSGSVITDVTTVRRLMNPPQPVADVAHDAAREVIVESDPVAAFAKHCVEAILMATTDTAASLGGCVPREHGYVFAPRTTTIASGAVAYKPKFEGQVGDVVFYAVQVQVDVRSYLSAPLGVEFYSLPVAIAKGGSPQAVDRVTRMGSLPAGPAVTLGYPTVVKPGSELYGVLSEFSVALLGDTGDLRRYVTTDSNISVIGGYAKDSIKLTSASVDGDESPALSDGAELAAHVDLNAVRSSGSIGADQFAYSLTLRCVGGSWFVVEVNAMPIVFADPKPTSSIPGGNK